MTYSKDLDDPRKDYYIPWGFGRARQSGPAYNATFSLENPGVLSEFTYQIFQPLNIRLGARYDWLNGKYKDHLTEKSSDVRYKFFSPKAGIVYSPLDNLDFYANYGRGFSMPGNFDDGQDGFFNPHNGLKLSKRDQFEFGIKYRPLEWLSLETTLYHLKTHNDTILDYSTWQSTLAGTTTRQGIEFSFLAKPLQDLSFSGHYAYMENKFDDFKIDGVDFSGYRLPFAPRQITNLEIAYAPKLGFGGRISYRWEKDMLYTDNPRTKMDGTPYLIGGGQAKPFKAPDKTFLDLQLNYTFNETYKLLFDVKNVIGKSYEGYAYGKDYVTGDYLVNYLDGRAFYLTFIANWDVK
jgi:outer membrane receptor protein involved in Fe transport